MALTLDLEQRVYFRDQLRSARASALLDAEGFTPIVEVLERLGATLLPSVTGLGKFRPVLLDIAAQAYSAPLPDDDRAAFMPLDTLFALVQHGRNDAVHQGAYARHLVGHSIQLALLIEEGLMVDSKCVADFMVRNPALAEPWQQIALARQQMLTNSFSYLPIRIDGAWKLLSDHSIAAFMTSAPNPAQALRERIDAAVMSGRLALLNPVIVSPTFPVCDTVQRSEGRPVLVQENGELLGIATPFDFL